MTTHTPAPWDDSTGPLLGADGTPVGVQQYNVSLFDQLERIRADRALMRAAPDMLATLREVTRCLAWHVEDQKRGVGMDGLALENARAAIDKATGGNQS